MDAAQWQQGVGFSKQMEEISSNACNNRAVQDKKPKPQEQLPCPRCNSHNTKFCYYNNYSLSQPRYFCKACRRYWTEGGTLRNVPVGGGSRKNKRSTSTSISSKINLDLNPASLTQFSAQNTKNHEGQDLNLAFPFTQRHEHSAPQFLQASTSSNSTPTSALELLRTGISSRPFGSLTPPMQFSNAIYSTSSSGLQEFIPSMSIPIAGGHESRHESLHGFQVNGARLLFPFGEAKQMPSRTDQVDEGKGLGIPTEYLNGIFNGRSW